MIFFKMPPGSGNVSFQRMTVMSQSCTTPKQSCHLSSTVNNERETPQNYVITI